MDEYAIAEAAPAPDGPCDDTCGCVTDPGPAREATGTTTSEAVPIACTLGPDELADRVADWRAVVDQSTDRRRIPGGVQLRFPRTIDVATLAGLAAAEQGCCRFFTFTLTVADAEVRIETTAPPDAQPLIDTLVGAPS